MGKDVEIVVRDKFIRDKVAELKTIATYVQSKRIDKPISRSIGKTIDEMNNLIKELNELSTDLGIFMMKNAMLCEKIATDFMEQDSKLANDYSTKKE